MGRGDPVESNTVILAGDYQSETGSTNPGNGDRIGHCFDPARVEQSQVFSQLERPPASLLLIKPAENHAVLELHVFAGVKF